MFRAITTLFVASIALASAIDPWPASLTPMACNANNQLETYPSTVTRCSAMDKPTSECTDLCNLCVNECLSVENGYTQFYVAGGTYPAQCACSILKKAPASHVSALTAITATTVVAIAAIAS